MDEPARGFSPQPSAAVRQAGGRHGLGQGSWCQRRRAWVVLSSAAAMDESCPTPRRIAGARELAAEQLEGVDRSFRPVLLVGFRNKRCGVAGDGDGPDFDWISRLPGRLVGHAGLAGVGMELPAPGRGTLRQLPQSVQTGAGAAGATAVLRQKWRQLRESGRPGTGPGGVRGHVTARVRSAGARLSGPRGGACAARSGRRVVMPCEQQAAAVRGAAARRAPAFHGSVHWRADRGSAW